MDGRFGEIVCENRELKPLFECVAIERSAQFDSSLTGFKKIQLPVLIFYLNPLHLAVYQIPQTGKQNS
jgi:hypothetical protein